MKQQPAARILLTLFFAGLIAFLIARRLPGSHVTAASPNRENHQEALAHYGFYLQEISKEAGLNFTHSAPSTLDPRLAPIMPEIASMGAAVSVVDFDRDGLPDVYVVNSGEGSKNCLFHNLGHYKFKDIAPELGIADMNRPEVGCCMGAVWGDYDNDGYEDLLIYRWGKPELYHNDQGHGFTLVKDSGLPNWINANSAIWLDYDGDGKLDLLITGYYPEDVNLWKLKDTKMMPESFEYAQNGGRKYLFRNLGNGKFEDVTAKVGLNSRRWALACAAADLRGTGRPDIFIANDYGVSELFANEDGKQFREIGKSAGVGFAPKSGMNASFGDILNQGQFAIYVSNISEPGNLIQGNNLWVPRPGTSGDTITYDNSATAMGVDLGGWSFGAQFGDLNNDGNLDIYLVNGFYSGDPNRSYWYDFSKVSGGNSGIIADAKNWPPFDGRSLSGYQQKRVWLNDGAGKFTEVAPIVGVTDTYDGRAVALADLDNSGALDVLVANQKGPLLLYKNTVTPENKWITFDLEGARSNRSAIGAQVRVFWDGKQQLQEVSGGCGFAAQNDRRLHFGLGKNPHIEKVVVRWPSGQTQTFTAPQIGQKLKVDQINKLKEPQ